MSSGTKKGNTYIFEMIISSPGMTDRCKAVINLSRQNMLVLCRVIEQAFSSPESQDELLALLSKESKDELVALVPELLSKAGLTDLNQKLKGLNQA